MIKLYLFNTHTPTHTTLSLSTSTNQTNWFESLKLSCKVCSVTHSITCLKWAIQYLRKRGTALIGKKTTCDFYLTIWSIQMTIIYDVDSKTGEKKICDNFNKRRLVIIIITSQLRTVNSVGTTKFRKHSNSALYYNSPILITRLNAVCCVKSLSWKVEHFLTIPPTNFSYSVKMLTLSTACI